MRDIILIGVLNAMLAVSAVGLARAETVDGDRVVIIDGDTVGMPCAVAFKGCSERIRLLDIDTAEVTRPRCDAELERGLAAKQRLAELLRGHQVEIVRSGKTDRYRRTLADIRVEGVDIGETLLNEGFAIKYRSGRAAWLQRAQHWCGPDYRK